jgi:SET domain-containing protein 6
VFVIEASEPEIPEGLISLIKLLQMPSDEWEKTQVKARSPKPKLDLPIARAALQVFERRLAEYPTTMEVCITFVLPETCPQADHIDSTFHQEDISILSSPSLRFTLNRRNAIIVRLGEKRILRSTLSALRRSLEELASEHESATSSVDESKGVKKRTRVSEERAPGSKKSRR